MLVSHEVSYRSLSPFESVEQLNEATKYHRNAHKLSQTELDVLELLSQYSCKYPGVSYLCKTNIGELIGKHRMTAVRACKRMVKLGIIKQFKVRLVTVSKQQTRLLFSRLRKADMRFRDKYREQIIEQIKAMLPLKCYTKRLKHL